MSSVVHLAALAGESRSSTDLERARRCLAAGVNASALFCNVDSMMSSWLELPTVAGECRSHTGSERDEKFLAGEVNNPAHFSAAAALRCFCDYVLVSHDAYTERA